MDTHFADRLVSAIRAKRAPVCVGIDPLVERLPPGILSEAGIPVPTEPTASGSVDAGAAADALLTFGREVLRVVAPHVPIVKINIAFFERYHVAGIRTYFELVKHARQAGLLVIGDVKRADIGHTSMQYAHAHLTAAGPGDAELLAPDAITINPYFGFDSIRPFVEVARETGRGLFVLVQTSNESAAEVQGLALSDGSTVCERVADLVQTWASDEGLIGSSDYSCIGAVVSPRDLESTERIRARMPNCVFLVPGFGAQGRTAQEVAKCFRPDGTGAFVNASRSVIFAFRDDRLRGQFGDDWQRCVEQACTDFVHTIRDVVPQA